ncbi:hypothetical protein SKAU_G00317240 [Synaphobranchus kaupii]|uniref:Uncharacterized protein n=1 Tax=Synaphobranchus kaupii TaxID=118154 RepID=A0A9Q1ILY9_SYNKA|nr:hypothetical protein SKAU_G00317240 [Synaphobranchus kaupii]
MGRDHVTCPSAHGAFSMALITLPSMALRAPLHVPAADQDKWRFFIAQKPHTKDKQGNQARDSGARASITNTRNVPAGEDGEICGASLNPLHIPVGLNRSHSTASHYFTSLAGS